MEDEKNLSLYAYNLAEDALVLAKKAMEHGGGDPEATGYTKEESDARYPTKQQVSSTYATKAALQNTNNDVTAVNQAVMDVEQDVSDLKTGLAGAATKTELANGLSGKVDKVSGKGLSTNDYTTADKNKLAGLSNYDDSILVAEIGAVANRGSKNILKLNSIGTSTVSGRTYQLNDDETITCSGEATGNAIKYIFGTGSTSVSAMLPVPVGKYIISGGVKNSTTVSIYIRNTADSTRYLYYHVEDVGKVIDIIENDVICVAVRTPKGVSNTVTVKPMLRDADIIDDTFVPYAPTNRELYEMILALMPSASLMSYTDDLAND